MDLWALELIPQWLSPPILRTFWAPFDCAQGRLLKSWPDTKQVYEARSIPQLKNLYSRRNHQEAATLHEAQQDKVTQVSL
jgi:hypothetical protein